MAPLETTLLAISFVLLVLIFVAALLRAPGTGSARLSVPMLLTLRIGLGIVFAILGVIGSLLPVMQGWVFFLLAVLVLFPQSRFAIKALEKIEARMPRMAARLRRMGIGTHRQPEDGTIRAE